MNATAETKYGGQTRLELELEFVQCLANPMYLHHLAVQKTFDDPSFVRYLEYLQYFRQPEYLRYLSYPGPTLQALELLQQKQFRADMVMPGLVERMIEQGYQSAMIGAA